MSTTTSPTVDPPISPAPVKYGHNGDSEYLTPYQVTILYRPSSILETAVACLSEKPQLVPFAHMRADHDMVINACEYFSPDLLVFGDEFARDDLLKLLGSGFQNILIFTEHDSARQKYQNNGEVFDERVVLFDIENIYKYVKLIDGLSSIYLMEHILCALYPKYTSIICPNEITYITGNYLLKSIMFTDKILGAGLLRLQMGIDSFDKISKAVTYGKALNEIFEKLAQVRMAEGIFYKAERDGKPYNLYAISGVDVVVEITNLSQIHPKIIEMGVDYVIIYVLEPHIVENNTYIGWRLHIININKKLSNGPGARLLIRNNIGNIVSNNDTISCWIPSDSIDIIPFLYTGSSAVASSHTNDNINEVI